LGDPVEEGVLVAGRQVLDPSGQLARIDFRLGQGRAGLGCDREQVGVGDLVLIPPATDHGIENDGDEDLVYVTAASPPVSMQELYENELAEVTGYDDDEDP